jgi:hypothetical protein
MAAQSSVEIEVERYGKYFASLTDDEFDNSNRYESGKSEYAYNIEKQKRINRIMDERKRIEAKQKEADRKRKDALLYSDSLASEICERIASGELLTCVCLDYHMPTVRRCTQWLRQYRDFKTLYDQSIGDRLNIFEEQLIEIADNAAKDVEIVEAKNSTRKILDPAKVTAAKLRIECRRLHLKAGRPQKWGETSTMITKSDDEFDPSNLSAEELEKCIADIDEKARIIRPEMRGASLF